MTTNLSIRRNHVGLDISIRGDMMILRSVPMFVGLAIKHLLTKGRAALQVVRVTVSMDNVDWEIV